MAIRFCQRKYQIEAFHQEIYVTLLEISAGISRKTQVKLYTITIW